MIKLTINDSEFRKLLESYPKTASRSAEIALDRTALAIRDAVKEEMRRVFDSPNPYTLSSLRITRTSNHNMRASVWFLDPERMSQHYLVPQVEGGFRQLKGFERGVGLGELVPSSKWASLDRYGNVSVRQIKLALAGIKKDSRAYVVITKHKTLPAGLYQRFKTSGGFGGKLRRAPLQRGQTKGRFTSAVLARGLKPLMIQGRHGDQVKPLLDFYGIANRVYEAKFRTTFLADLTKRMS